MKKNVLLALLSIALCSNTDLIAQVGKPWLIGGNNLTGNRGIGSNNNFALGFRTNGIERARITADGLFGINTSTFNEPYRLKVSHTDFGLDIENHSSSDDWELFTASPPATCNYISIQIFVDRLILLPVFIQQYQTNGSKKILSRCQLCLKKSIN